MKKYLVSLAILGCSIGASAASLDVGDLVGRNIVVDQEQGQISGILEVKARQAGRQTASLKATVKGQGVNCSGNADSIDDQTLLSIMNCDDGAQVRVEISVAGLSKENIVSYLQGSFATSVSMKVASRKDSTSLYKYSFSGTVDIKNLDAQ